MRRAKPFTFFFAVVLFFSLSFIHQSESASKSSSASNSSSLGQDLKRLAAVNGPYTFAVIGDNRSGDKVYKKVIAQMMKRKPLFVVNSGDLIPNPGNRDQWRNFWEVSKDIDVPYFLTPGNHDIDDKNSQEVWRDEVNLPGDETYYSFTVGKDLFVILNSCDPENEKKITGRQLAWLSRTLDPAKYEHQFVFVHHPLFLFQGATHEHDSLDKYPEDRDRLHNLFVQKKVTAVFEGHEHVYKRMQEGGIDYIISGGAGAPLYGKWTFNHVLVIEVDGPHIEVKTIDREGAMRDNFVIKG